MAEIRGFFWDVGGVLLTNGWDRASRRRAVETFGLEREEFESRHELVSSAFEMGKLTLDAYLEQTIFYRPRAFTRQAVVDFMLAQSQPYPEALGIVDRLAQSGRYLMATLNNESLELNLHRIRHFDLRRHFGLFLSSCFLGVQKPDEAIYRVALRLTQLAPHESVFIDDRALNLECAQRLGMHTIHYRGPAQLQDELRRLGVDI